MAEETIKVRNKTYRYEYFNKCEFCDMIGINGDCMLPKKVECPRNYIFRRTED